MRLPPPRSWERVSDALWAITDRETLRVTNERLVQTLVGSLVGTDVATKLNSFFTTFGELPSPTDILEGKVKSFDYEKMEAKKTSICTLRHYSGSDPRNERTL